ncbi:hypothetical protein [Fructobacillus durionis]|uniref:Uncharacterized protein n=1 Tax=Fructobacillus durionis TaxID=283737 RepID=A0A1I1HIQ7_9LACO|nr:hypothetical protein [Fructobacillus durionis]SFC23731.1 hypothetical protein SAMN05660453_0024 [Fructobacillus durionis]
MHKITKQTFKEAFDEIEELSFVRDESKPVIEQEWVNSHTAVYALIEELQENYAPTLELTKEQKDIWDKSYSKGWAKKDFIYFIDILYIEDNSTNLFTELLSEFRSHSRVLMNAWLHPESIKVVE